MNSEKQDLRVSLRRKRVQALMVDKESGGGAEARLASMAQPLVAEPFVAGNIPKIVSGYIPMNEEIDPRPLMAAFSDAGARLCLPEVVGNENPLQFREWSPGDLLSSGVWGTLQPLTDAELLTPDFILVPLLAVDLKGTRIGYGGGYYDRTLSKLRSSDKAVRAFGVAFDEQIVDELPSEPHDEMLDGLFTPHSCIIWDEAGQLRYLAQQ